MVLFFFFFYNFPLNCLSKIVYFANIFAPLFTLFLNNLLLSLGRLVLESVNS